MDYSEKRWIFCVDKRIIILGCQILYKMLFNVIVDIKKNCVVTIKDGNVKGGLGDFDSRWNAIEYIGNM